MDEANNHDAQRPRASLRGKGPRILLGKESLSDLLSGERGTPAEQSASTAGPVDASALPLTPEETEALLDSLTAAFPYESGAPDAAPDAASAASASSALDTQPPAWWEESADLPDRPDVDDQPQTFRAAAAAPVYSGVPLAERSREDMAAAPDPAYQPHPAVDALTPQSAEIWTVAEPDEAPDEILAGEVAGESVAETVVEGGGEVVTVGSRAAQAASPAQPDEPADEAAAQPYELPDPFGPIPARTPARTLFEDTTPADNTLLGLLVDDERLRKLSQQIDAIQEELVQPVYGDRAVTDAYQQELLQASSLMLASRENYDNARAIVYRVRSEMNRQRKVDADIMRYRPLLLNYYIGWGIALGVLFLLKALFVGVTDAVGVGLFSALYYPMLLGVVGALLGGYLTLERHTTRLRDFDPIHISWYLFNPLLGGGMGLLMFLLASIANEDLLHESATAPEYAITYLLCVVAGMNQNSVLRQVNDLVRRFGRGQR